MLGGRHGTGPWGPGLPWEEEELGAQSIWVCVPPSLLNMEVPKDLPRLWVGPGAAQGPPHGGE